MYYTWLLNVVPVLIRFTESVQPAFFSVCVCPALAKTSVNFSACAKCVFPIISRYCATFLEFLRDVFQAQATRWVGGEEARYAACINTRAWISEIGGRTPLDLGHGRISCFLYTSCSPLLCGTKADIWLSEALYHDGMHWGVWMVAEYQWKSFIDLTRQEDKNRNMNSSPCIRVCLTERRWNEMEIENERDMQEYNRENFIGTHVLKNNQSNSKAIKLYSS